MRRLLLCLMIAVSSCPVRADQVLTWLLLDNPPSMVVAGDQLVDGLVKPKLDLLRTLLPHYQHQTRVVSLARLHKSLNDGEPVCSFLLKSPEREKIMLFSRPAMVAYVHYAVLRTEVFKQIGSPAQISLAQLLRRHLRGILQKDRSYGPRLDHQLIAMQTDALKAEGLLRDVVQPDDTLLQLVVKNRADFTFNFPIVVNYWKKQNPEQAAQLTIVRLSEQAEFDLAYIACANSAWGQQVISAINIILDTALRDPKYQYADDLYLDPSLRAAFHRFYEKSLLPQSAH